MPPDELSQADVMTTLLRMERANADSTVEIKGHLVKFEGRLDAFGDEMSTFRNHIFGSKPPGQRIPSRGEMPAVRVPRPDVISGETKTSNESGLNGANGPDTPKRVALVDEIAVAKQKSNSASFEVEAHEGRLAAVETEVKETKTLAQQLLELQKAQSKHYGLMTKKGEIVKGRGTLVSVEGFKQLALLVTLITSLVTAVGTSYAIATGRLPLPSVSHGQTPAPAP
jgi:hypothetical protein